MGQQNDKLASENKSISKKLVNTPNNCVVDSLKGFVLAHANAKLLEGWNVILRSDIETFTKEEKVVLITGGGSGHEPAHVGYVGRGMLTAAVCGDVFTSPSSASILNTIVTCSNGAGVLLIVKNYTGDRLSFGKAAEVAKSQGINVEMVVVGEDCALTSKDKSAGRRGLCGTVFIHKMAGAMAEEGKSLSEIVAFLNTATSEMGTISISLSPCSIPGKPANFSIADDTVEFGLGIHGEAGVVQVKISSASTLVKQMIDHLWNSEFLPSIEGKEVSVIVNNLGGTSNLELTIIAKEALEYLASLKVVVKRCYVGAFVTSMEMAGVSLTIMLLNDEKIKYLDAPCSAPAWQCDGLINDINDITITCKKTEEANQEWNEKAEGIGIPLYHCVKKACTTLIDNESKLNELDRAGGDGDTGTTLARGAKGLFLKLSDENHLQLPVNSPRELFLSIAKEVETTMGGSSGALISLLFTAAANRLTRDTNMEDFISALEQGIAVMKKYGGAEEGDRTMLDALCPCFYSMGESLKSKVSAKEMLTMAAKATRAGADSTLSMHAKAGRASYVSDTHLTQPDPGAVAVALVFEAIDKAFSKLQK